MIKWLKLNQTNHKIMEDKKGLFQWEFLGIIKTYDESHHTSTERQEYFFSLQALCPWFVAPSSHMEIHVPSPAERNQLLPSEVLNHTAVGTVVESSNVNVRLVLQRASWIRTLFFLSSNRAEASRLLPACPIVTTLIIKKLCIN